MRYISTRGTTEPQNFLSILLGGLAADGGLFLPERYPQISADDLAKWRSLSYADLAVAVLSLYIDDIAAEDLQRLCRETYQAKTYPYARYSVAAEQITPLTPLYNKVFLLELSNGPTLAFKDMAMQLLGNLFQFALQKNNASLNIVGATSGDTGSAAEYAMRGKSNIRVFMLSPHNKMSDFQRAQMFSLDDNNIFNIATTGVFDEAQDVVKAISQDADFKNKYQIGVVNSINWARVLAQVVYYFKAYFAATKNNQQPVSFCVPSGNFGNICAGHIARMMGLPIRQLILATNENNVLDEFFRTGVYRPRRASETAITSSPSMDISKASNFERFFFDLVGRNSETLRHYWQMIDQGGAIDIRHTEYFSQLAKFGFVSGQSSHQQRIETIRHTWQKYGVLIDPHTADGLSVAQRVHQGDEPLIILETAQPVKFAATLEEAIGKVPPRPKAFDHIEDLPQKYVVLPPDATTIKDYIASHCDGNSGAANS